MNLNYLMHYISCELHTVIRQYSLDKVLIKQICNRPNFKDLVLQKTENERFLLEKLSMEGPLLVGDKNLIAYSVITTSKYIFVIGPIKLEGTIFFNNQLPESILDETWLHTVSESDLNKFAKNSILLYNLLHEMPVTIDDIIYRNCVNVNTNTEIQKDFSSTLFNNQESSKTHNPYDQEVREFSSIRNGDLELLKQSHSEDILDKCGVLAKDTLRSNKNLCIVVITLASRAAIEGGVPPEISYSLSDIYICKIEEVSDLGTLRYITREAEYQYAEMVQTIKKQKHQQVNNLASNSNLYIDKCKDYIFKNLHDKIVVSDIAKELKITSKYLSELFIRHEGITITKFILEQKIGRAKNLLIYSTYSYSEIATYLGFASQSHFGNKFKISTTLTPRQYRQKYACKSFHCNEGIE